MSYAVVVLMPNGRRHSIKVTPNLSNLQILEAVCAKQGLKPEEYDLKHYNRILDLSSTVHYSNIPNNALLELVQASKHREEHLVNVGIQLESGDRVIDNFPPSVTLWDVVNHWEIIRAIILSSTVEDEVVPICVYMRNEIVGEAQLRQTTLKSLGLLSGKAMIRLIFRPASILKQQAHVEVPIPKMPKQSKADDSDVRPFVPAKKQKEQPLNYIRNVPKQNTPDMAFASTSSDYSPPRKRSDAIQAPISLENGEKSPFNPTMQSSRAIHPIHETLPSKTPPPSPKKDKKDTKSSKKVVGRDERLIELGERGALLFSLDSIRANAGEDLPDEFFNLTIDDVKYLFYDLKRKREELENVPLQTKLLREAEQQKKLNKYPETVIRIMFPDRLVLQGLFITTERGIRKHPDWGGIYTCALKYHSLTSVSDVMDFIRRYITDENADFYLFTAPPKRVLNPNEQLGQASLVPKAVVHFGGSSGHPVKEEFRKKLSTAAAANRAASMTGPKPTVDAPTNI